MPGVSRRPTVRWFLVAFLLLFLLAWYTDDSDELSAARKPKWGPKTPKASKKSQKHEEAPLAAPRPAPRPAPQEELPWRDSGNEESWYHGGDNAGGWDAPAPDEYALEEAAASEAAAPEAAPPEASFLILKSAKTADDYLEYFKDVVDQEPMKISQTKSTCNWPSMDQVNFQFGADRDWVEKDRSDAEIAEHQKEWQDFIKNDLIPYKDVADKFSGQGIVVCAGNGDSMSRLHVMLKMLRHHGTELPVEVHFFGDKELSPDNRASLQSIYPNIYFNDLSGPGVILPTKHDNPVINYNVKLASLLNSRFAEPLLIDSDNVPVSDPKSIFESDTYKNFGSVFYPDIARTRPQNPMWAITNTHCRTDEYELESGQLLVDKRKFWYHLQLAAWFGHHDYYQEFLLGDKDCFRFAWHALKTPYGRPFRWITSVGFVSRPEGHAVFPESDDDAAMAVADMSNDKYQGGPNSFYCGHTFGQHHPDGPAAPILFLHGGLLKTLHVAQISHARDHSHGLFNAYKQSSKASGINDVIEKIDIIFDGGVTYLDTVMQSTLEKSALCTDMGEVEPMPIGDFGTPELKGFEEAFDKAGGFWMLSIGRPRPD